jgi:hypothetical protein
MMRREAPVRFAGASPFCIGFPGKARHRPPPFPILPFRTGNPHGRGRHGRNGAAAICIRDSSSAQVSEVRSDYNHFYTPGYAPGGYNMFTIGGDCVKGTLLSLDAWRSRTGNDRFGGILGKTLGLILP